MFNNSRLCRGRHCKLSSQDQVIDAKVVTLSIS